jgi:hypothetical protein
LTTIDPGKVRDTVISLDKVEKPLPARTRVPGMESAGTSVGVAMLSNFGRIVPMICVAETNVSLETV